MPDGTPLARSDSKNWCIACQNWQLEVDPEDGGRIVEFALDGQNALITRVECSVAYGSSFWPSPQSDWDWPPPLEFDREPWAARLEGGTLLLESRPNAALGLRGEQRFRASSLGGGVNIEQTLRNVSDVPRRVAPWQNSRVRPNGLTFFPSSSESFANSTLKLAPERGVVWFLHDPETMRENAKAFLDSSEGWLAHVDGDLLFVKAFAKLSRTELAPGQGQIEIYSDRTGSFVEIEQQGPHTELAPGECVNWEVRWMLARLPSDVRVEPGSSRLLDVARRLVATS